MARLLGEINGTEQRAKGDHEGDFIVGSAVSGSRTLDHPQQCDRSILTRVHATAGTYAGHLH